MFAVYHVERFDTKLTVAITDGIDGRVGVVSAAYCSIETPTSDGRHMI
jgi:hypothetical protein